MYACGKENRDSNLVHTFEDLLNGERDIAKIVTLVELDRNNATCSKNLEGTGVYIMDKLGLSKQHKAILRSDIECLKGALKYKLSTDVGLIFCNSVPNTIISIIAKIQKRLQIKLNEYKVRNKTRMSKPSIEFVDESIRSAKVARHKTGSKRRHTLLKASNPFSEFDYQNECNKLKNQKKQKKDKVTVGLSDSEFEVYEMLKVLFHNNYMREKEFKTHVVLGKEIQKFLDYYRSGSINHYTSKGLDLNEVQNHVVSQGNRLSLGDRNLDPNIQNHVF